MPSFSGSSAGHAFTALAHSIIEMSPLPSASTFSKMRSIAFPDTLDFLSDAARSALVTLPVDSLSIHAKYCIGVRYSANADAWWREGE
eukprot:1232409-Prymnesium_polylepis.1